MPVLPVCLIDPVWEQCVVFLPVHPEVVPTHPLGCHRWRVPDRVVFDHVVSALVLGVGDERIASPGCSDRTIRRRVHKCAAGVGQRLHQAVLAQFDCLIGLELHDLLVDGCHVQAPCGGEKASPSPVNRGRLGRKLSVVTDATGLPLFVVVAAGNRHDGPLLASTLAGLDRLGPLAHRAHACLDDGLWPRPPLPGALRNGRDVVRVLSRDLHCGSCPRPTWPAAASLAWTSHPSPPVRRPIAERSKLVHPSPD